MAVIKYKKAADGQIEGCVPEREYPGQADGGKNLAGICNGKKCPDVVKWNRQQRQKAGTPLERPGR